MWRVSRTITQFIVVRYLLWRLNDWFITIAWETRGDRCRDGKTCNHVHFSREKRNSSSTYVIISNIVTAFRENWEPNRLTECFCLFFEMKNIIYTRKTNAFSFWLLFSDKNIFSWKNPPDFLHLYSSNLFA